MGHHEDITWIPLSSAVLIVGFFGVMGMLWALLAVMIGLAYPMTPVTGLRATGLACLFWPLFAAAFIGQAGFPVSGMALVALVGFVGGLVGLLVLRLLNRVA